MRMRLGLVCIIRRRAANSFPRTASAGCGSAPRGRRRHGNRGQHPAGVQKQHGRILRGDGVDHERLPGMQAYARRRFRRGQRCSARCCCPQTSLISMMTLPERTTPSCSVGAPSIRMISPFCRLAPSRSGSSAARRFPPGSCREKAGRSSNESAYFFLLHVGMPTDFHD